MNIKLVKLKSFPYEDIVTIIDYDNNDCYFVNPMFISSEHDEEDNHKIQFRFMLPFFMAAQSDVRISNSEIVYMIEPLDYIKEEYLECLNNIYDGNDEEITQAIHELQSEDNPTIH